MKTSKKYEEFEGKDIIWYIEHPDELRRLMEGIIDDELTKGRIRTIYVRVNYGNDTIHDIAKYYNLPEKVIRDIGNGKLFADITSKSFY